MIDRRRLCFSIKAPVALKPTCHIRNGKVHALNHTLSHAHRVRSNAVTLVLFPRSNQPLRIHPMQIVLCMCAANISKCLIDTVGLRNYVPPVNRCYIPIVSHLACISLTSGLRINFRGSTTSLLLDRVAADFPSGFPKVAADISSHATASPVQYFEFSSYANGAGRDPRTIPCKYSASGTYWRE
jgi:hypothetical protein